MESLKNLILHGKTEPDLPPEVFNFPHGCSCRYSQNGHLYIYSVLCIYICWHIIICIVLALCVCVDFKCFSTKVGHCKWVVYPPGIEVMRPSYFTRLVFVFVFVFCVCVCICIWCLCFASIAPQLLMGCLPPWYWGHAPHLILSDWFIASHKYKKHNHCIENQIDSMTILIN